MFILGLIPARYASSRLPGKPLLDIEGKPMIVRVYEQAVNANLVDEVLVATDDKRIYHSVISHGGKAIMTKNDHPSGTDRIAEVLTHRGDVDIVINIQGDEPLIDPQQIDALAKAISQSKTCSIFSMKKRIDDLEKLHNPHIVKVVTNSRNEALYFSRSAIPFPRNDRGAKFYQHIGLYAYTREALLKISKLPPSTLESTEELEQLRWLEKGWKIGMIETQQETIAIDTAEDYKNLLYQLKNNK